MADISSLIELFVVEAQIAEGIPAEWLEKQGRAVHGTIGQPVQKNKRMPDWTQEEDADILQTRSRLSLEEIGQTLGRSANSIKVRGYRIQAEAPRHAAGFISGNEMAAILGVDLHKPPAWMERGLLELEVIPYDQRRVWRRTTWPAFLRFLIRPASWV